MVNIIPRKAKRITASFLAVCVFAMAVLPYGNISFANTENPDTPTSIDITIPANEKLVIGTEKGMITTVDEPSSDEGKEEGTTDPVNKVGEEEKSTDLADEVGEEEKSTDPVNEVGEEEKSTDPVNEVGEDEKTTDLADEVGEEEKSTDPVNEVGEDEKSTDPVNEVGEEEKSTDPVNKDGEEEKTTDPVNEVGEDEKTTDLVNEVEKDETSNEANSGELKNEPSSDEELLTYTNNGGDTVTLSNDPEMSDFKAKVLRGIEEINTGYAKMGDTVVLEYTTVNCSDALKVIFDGTEYVLKDLTADSKIIFKNLGENRYSISKVLEDTDSVGSIGFKFEDGNMTWNCDTKIIYDNSLPEFSFNIEYGNLATGTATINGTPKDNNGISDVSVYKDETWNSISGAKSGETFKYTVDTKGTYKFRVTDVAGNSIEKDVVVGNGNEGMIVRRLPTKTTYLKNEEISLDGGYLKITNTFGETVTTDPNVELICFCDDGCSCAVDGVCDPANGCQNSDYVIPMSLATIVSREEVSKVGNETTKRVTLAYDIYRTTFEIIEKDINKYKIDITPNSGEITDGSSITIGVQVTKEAADAADIVKKYYTWSTLPDNIGNEVYEAAFMGDAQNEGEPTEIISDGIFTYTNILTDSGENVDSGKHWKYDAVNGIYRSEYIGYGKDASTSQKRITLDSGDTDGIISFEYMTNSPSGDILTVTINGEEVLKRDGKYNWQSFSRKFNANDDGKYIIDLCFARSGVTSGYSNNYVAIRNLTFTGDKQWKELNGDSVTLLSEDAVGKNNYLYVKVVNADNESTVAFSGNFEYQSVLEDISIETVPSNTVYYYTSGSTSNLIPTEAIVTGGAITLKYSKGSSKIPMSIVNSDNQEELNANVSVWARPLKNSDDGVLKNDVWYKNINLNYPGVWDIKVEYGDDENGTFSDYYTITVNYNKSDSSSIFENRDVKVNKPELVEGMVPVKWVEVERDGKTEGFWVTTTEYDTEWYDYSSSSKLWANVMLKDEIAIREVPNPKDKSLALNNLAGKRIDAYGSMFVWVPRFSYAINTGANADAFPFLVNWSNGTVDDVDYCKTPAFTYDTKELNGFWFGKYEASDNNGIVEVKPNRNSGFEGVTVEDAYDYSKNMFQNNSLEYGIVEDAVSHLVTMAEWDAIAILAMCEEQYAMSPRANAYYNNNGKDSYTGYNSSEVLVELNDDADSSTTYNMSGIFDMHGAAPEILSVVFDPSNTNPDVDVFDLYDATIMSNWLLSKLYEEGLWDGSSEEVVIGNFYSSFIMEDGADVVVRGYSADGGIEDGIFNTYILTNDTLTGIPSVGFRPSILVTEGSTSGAVKIESAKLSIQGKGQDVKHAGVGDVIQLTIKASNDEINIKDVLVNGKEPTSSIPVLGSAANEWMFTYKVEKNDPNGKVEISYKYKVHGESDSEYKEGPNDVNTIYVDTTPSDADIGLSDDKKKIEITVIAGNESDSGVKIIKVERRDEGDEEPGSDFFGEGGETVDLGDGGKGSVDVTGPGIYYIYIEDEAGNTIIKKITITSGSGEGEFDINDTVPKLESMTLSVLKDGSYVTDAQYVKRLETVKVDMTFDQLLTVGPTVYVLGEKAVVSGDESNKKLWTAVVNRVGSQYAYEDIPITISDYEYFGNKGDVVTETFDDLNADGTSGVIVPYDGSLVKINVSEPTLLNKNGEVWEVVDAFEAGKPIGLEYVITFSDPVYTRDNIERAGMSNLEPSSINISSSNVDITTDDMTADIAVNTFLDPDTGIEVPEKRVIRFENIVGEGRFGFSIAGAKYSDDLSSFTNFVAQDKFGNPNEQFSTSGAGDANTPMIDTRPPVLTNVSIYSNNENPKYAKNGDTITVKFAVSEELGTLPTVTIFENDVLVNYVEGSYVAEYVIPDDAEYTEGIVPFSVSGYKDKVGNVGNSLTQDDLNSFENVIYDITAPTVSIDPNGGEFTDTTVAVTLSDAPAGIKDSILRYCWSTTNTEPEIAENEWDLVAVSGNNAVISSPTGLNESRYLIIKGVKDNSGNESATFISNEFVFSNIIPSLEISDPDVLYTKSGDIVYTITYFDTANIDLTLDKINLIKTGTADLDAETGVITISGEGNSTRVVTISNVIGDGTIGIEVLPGSASSSSGVKDDKTVRSLTVGVDNTAPTVTFDPENSLTALASLAVRVTVVDPLVNNVSSGLATNDIKYAWSVDGENVPTEWQDFTLVNSVASIDVPSENGDWYLWIKSVEDSVGNVIGDTVGGLYKIDVVEPLIEVTSIYTDNTINTIANNGNTITIEMVSNKDLVMKPTVTINCGSDVRTVPAENVTGSGKNWVATYTVPIDEADWVDETVLGYSISNYTCESGYTGATVTESNSGIMYKSHYEVIITTSPATVVDDSDPDNVITTPGVVTGAGEYGANESVTITATPATGYRFDKWTVMGVSGLSDLTLPEQTFIMPNGNVMAVANFVKTWTVVFKGYDGEVLSTQVVDNGSAAIAPVAPSRSGYSFTGWEPTPSDANFLNVSCDMELVATYSRKSYTITAYAGSNGTITPAGSVSVSYGANKRFNISPNNGYRILDVIVDGVSVGAVNTYLFEDVTSNHTIHVTFTEDIRYEVEGEWYYDNIEVETDNIEYVFRSRETLDEFEDASATIMIENPYSVNVSFEYILNARDDAMFGITINGKPLRRVIESSDTWTTFNETVEPVDGKIVIGLTYSKGENPTEDESFLDLAAIKNLEVE